MALLSPYATWAQYKARNSGIVTDTDQTLYEGYLLTASRLIELWTGRSFNATSAGVTRYFDGNGDRELYVDDYTALTAATLDVDGDGVYETTLDVATIANHPRNAAERSDPYTSVLLLTTADVFAWPIVPAGVCLVGTWGWTAVPQPIVDATIVIARAVADLVKGGLTLTLNDVDQALRVNPGMFDLRRALYQDYSRRVAGFPL